jgi:two-component system KDP operon response regulator KdpE
VQQKPFILIVEDDAQLRKIIATNLAARGYLAFQAETFSEAAEQLAARPQLIILDINLPDATGWDVALWAETTSALAPTIIISGTTPDRRHMKRFTPMSFLSKPFDIRQLLELVEMYVPAA